MLSLASHVTRQAMRFAAPLLVTAWLAACAMPHHSDASAPPPDPFDPAATQLLDDTQWQLASWRHADGSTTDVPPQNDAAGPAHATITLALSTAGGQRQVSGFSGCNHYSGTYVLKNGLLSFSPLVSTKKACTAAAGQIESAWLGALAHIAHSGVQMRAPQQLLLQLDNGDRLTFNRMISH